MTSTSKTVVFFGTDNFSAQSLNRLIEDGFSIAAVITKPDSPQGRGRKLTPPAVKIIAEQHDITVWQPERLLDIADNIRALDSPIGVLVSYGKIIPQSIIDLFSPGIVNVHPSLLPKYRGPSPIETTILNGDEETGVSIMQLSAAMDAGPVYDQTTVSLSGRESSPELEEILGGIGAKRLSEILPTIISGDLQPKPQDDSKATYCRLLKKSDAQLDPAKFTAAEAERRIRAHLAFPKTKLTVLGQPIIVQKAQVVEHPTSEIDVACKGGSYLRIEKLIGPSGREMTAGDFLRGYKK